MVADSNSSRRHACASAARALQLTLLAFCVLAVASALLIYLVAPAIYVQMLLGAGQPADVRPLAVTAALAGVLILVAVLAVGVLRRWRWVFWLLMVAFTFSILQIPAGALELAGIVPASIPTWYVLARMLAGALLFVIGVWMIRLYRRCGVWAMGQPRP